MSGLILSLIRAESRIKRPVAVLYNLECRANISMVSKVFQIQFGEIVIRTFRYDEGLLEMDFLIVKRCVDVMWPSNTPWQSITSFLPLSYLP